MKKNHASRRESRKSTTLKSGAVPPAQRLSSSASAATAATSASKSARAIAPGPFQPTWQSLVDDYRCPEWFRDAKFGIWAHWSAQCVPEHGDWYARNMYIQGDPQNEYHVRTYGHPSKFGFMEIENLWKAERWEPEALIARYKRAGAKYFFALANHHDNLDAYPSRYHAWNSMNVGPKRDIVGDWAKAARAAGLRFGVSNHSAHAWHWYQPAYGCDPEGSQAGLRYDAATLTKADGKGKWWDGLDPQELYTGSTYPLPEGIRTIRAAKDWHEHNDRIWDENPPVHNAAFVERWFLRCQDLVDRYQPDILYFDDVGLPLGQAGLDIAAHYYNSALQWSGGKLDVVLNAKQLPPQHRPAMVEDIERGVAMGLLPQPWQTDTCIGSWHYDRGLFEKHGYKTVGQIVHMLIEIVSKNGNLMLSVPMRADGTIDEDETAFLDGMAAWIAINGEGIFATRPWTHYGEGSSTTETPEAGQFGGAIDVRRAPYTSTDLRFTRKGDTLYAFFLAWPADRVVTIKSLASGAAVRGKVQRVELLGSGPVGFDQGSDGLTVQLPEKKPGEHAYGLKLSGLNLT